MNKWLSIFLIVVSIFALMVVWGHVVKHMAVQAAIEEVQKMPRPYSPGIEALNINEQ